MDVPDAIIAILLAEAIAAGLASGGELRFEEELLVAWPNLAKRVIPI